MINVLDRAFNIIEYIAGEPERSRPLGEIADKFSLNHATCANILKTLVKRNYIDQEAPRKGYTLGPMAYFLARKGPYGKDLVNVVEPRIEKLAMELQETVLISTMNRNKRSILCQVDGGRDIQIKREILLLDDAYRTATGRLLLAYMSVAERENFIRANGVGGKYWPEAKTKTKLMSECERIQKAGRAIRNEGSEVIAIAYPIKQKESVVAALGLFLPRHRFAGAHKQKVLGGMRKTAEEISRKLSASL